MLKIFAGLKGSGKTKHLIELVNSAQSTTNGNVVCIEMGTKLIHEINSATRLINIADYGVDDWQKLYGPSIYLHAAGTPIWTVLKNLPVR